MINAKHKNTNRFMLMRNNTRVNCVEGSIGGVNLTVTYWTPTPKELAELNAGANVAILLAIPPNTHPPIMVLTGELPDETGL